MGQLTGKVAIVTGGTTGIGLATAKRFAAEGAQVYVTGRRKPELDAAVQDIGSGAVGIQGDISDLADLDRLYAAVEQDGRRIDVLFANAGGGEFARLEEVTEEHFDQTFGVNVRGLLFTVQKALPLLNEGASVIVPGSSTAMSGAEAFGVYAATKAAVRSLARTWANELKGRGIRVNVIVPGPIDTPGIMRPRPRRGAGRTAQGLPGEPGAAGPHGPFRGGGRRRTVPRLRPEQLHHGFRAARRRRPEPGLSSATAVEAGTESPPRHGRPDTGDGTGTGRPRCRAARVLPASAARGGGRQARPGGRGPDRRCAPRRTDRPADRGRHPADLRWTHRGRAHGPGRGDPDLARTDGTRCDQSGGG